MSVVEFTEEELVAKVDPVAKVAVADVVRKMPELDYAQAIEVETARKFGVTVAELRGRARHAHVVQARHAFWRALRALGWSYPAIGLHTGHDHTTVMCALKGTRRKQRRAHLIELATGHA